MADTKYNGWTNKATWLVNLWLTNEQSTSEEMSSIARDFMTKHHVADALREYVESILPELDGFASDLMTYSLDSVNWVEIAEHAIEDAEVE
jgi:hypothetical protein